MSAPSSSLESEEAKHGNDFVEKIEPTPTHATYYSTNDAASLTPAHREYLLERYGTLDLDPLPDYGDADPYNWPSWKVGLLRLRVRLLLIGHYFRKSPI